MNSFLIPSILTVAEDDDWVEEGVDAHGYHTYTSTGRKNLTARYHPNDGSVMVTVR